MLTPSYIREYVLSKFNSVGKLCADDTEFTMPSIFIENDYKRHFSINVETGMWQDFKAAEKGNFVQFYSEVEGISRKAAYSKLLFDSYMMSDEEKTERPHPRKIGNLPDFSKATKVTAGMSFHTTTVCDLSELVSQEDKASPMSSAWLICMERKLFDLGEDSRVYYLWPEGDYANRLVIPYNKPNGDPFFFQARALYPNQEPKYLNPTNSLLKSSDILYPFDEEEDYVVVCEGPIDAISFQLQGVNATCTQTAHTSGIQMELLREFGGRIICAYNQDKAGKKGQATLKRMAMKKRVDPDKVWHCSSGELDWNEKHIRGDDLKDIIQCDSLPLDWRVELGNA